MSAPTPNQMPGAAVTPPAEGAAPTPPAAAPAPTQPVAPAPPEPPNPDKAPPPWGSDDEFKPDKAWKLIQNLRGELDQYKAKADPVLAEHEALRRASQTELDRIKEDIAQVTGRADTWRSQAVRSKAEALAAGRFIDADVAVTLIGDLTEYATDDGIDVQKLTSRLDQLAQDKPFLVTSQPAQGFTPNRAQGQSGNGPVPLDAQIKAAQESGNIMQSIALKQQKLYQK